MKSPFTGKEMELAYTPLSSKADKYYQCLDTKALFLSNHISKKDLIESQRIKKILLDGMKA